MYYYKIFDINNNFIGVEDSTSLRYYNKKHKRIFCCLESLAQYIMVKNQLYRIEWLHDEDKEQIGKYPIAEMQVISYEEYKKLKNEILV